MQIDIIAGARPNFMKIAPIIGALEQRKRSGSRLDYRLIHTGQHYDSRMSASFFEQLGIPEPHANLGVGSGTQAEQAAAIMTGYEALLQESRPSLCLVVGDVTSTMATAITARKMGVPVAHVEAGIRSGDWAMPEEINRVVTDSVTNWFFTTSEQANANLRSAGITDDRIFFVGNTMIDTLLSNLPRLRRPRFFEELNLQQRKYLVLTMHRPSNVDRVETLSKWLLEIEQASRGWPVIFPVHPRTAKNIAAMERTPSNLHLVDAQPYLEFIYLVRGACAVITDSGGVTEEATVLGVPCITLRTTTERPETVSIGTNELVGEDPARLRTALDLLFENGWKKGGIPERWDGRTGERIVQHLEALVTA